ncbi:YhfG family protein [Photobacterium indicum]|jgi:hypothetical protein|uniref:YhfG family protein n=1 Tax=Photobacterium indicum TaxID=81447 RepID=UPI003D152C88
MQKEAHMLKAETTENAESKLTKDQMRKQFKRLSSRNYKASLQLEGFDIEPTKRETKSTQSEKEQIESLIRYYDR